MHLLWNSMKLLIVQSVKKKIQIKISLETTSTHSGKGNILKSICAHAVCGKSFNRKSTAIAHNKLHMERNNICPFDQCNKAFVRKQDLADHLNSHTGMKPYSCNQRKRSFSSQSSFSHHKATCFQKVECSECNQKFTSKSTLYDHQKSEHENEAFVCACGKRYKWQTNLARHRRDCTIERQS